MMVILMMMMVMLMIMVVVMLMMMVMLMMVMVIIIKTCCLGLQAMRNSCSAWFPSSVEETIILVSL